MANSICLRDNISVTASLRKPVLLPLLFLCLAALPCVAQHRGSALDALTPTPQQQAQREQNHRAVRTGPLPSARIPVGPLGFLPPGKLFITFRLSHLSLDFLDEKHLLFTFHKPGLLRRDPNQKKGDDDQVVHAVVLEIPSGKLLTETEWRLHDRNRYLWSLKDGRFLLRIRSNLFYSDATFRLEPYLHLPGSMRMALLDPTGQTLLAETLEPVSLQPTPVSTGDDDERATPPSEWVGLRFIRLKDHTLLAAAHDRSFLKIPTLAEGWLGTLPAANNQWLLRLNFYDRRVAELISIHSACTPIVETLSHDVLQTTTCRSDAKDRLVTAYGLDGAKLWEQPLPPNFIWPYTDRSADGSRFATAYLAINHPLSLSDPFSAEDIQQQVVHVYDTETGKEQLAAPASPIADSGQNFSLSPSGRRVAILNGNAIEIYDLPAAPAVRHPISASAFLKDQKEASAPAPTAAPTLSHPVQAPPAKPVVATPPQPAVPELPPDPQHKHLPDLELPPLPSSTGQNPPQ